jgi:general secretion pathway protein F/type IV pilus assembly protein PilC
MLFAYTKLTKDGKALKGRGEFSSEAEAQARVLEEGEFLIDLKSLNSKKFKSLTLSERFDFTYQMHQLVGAGLPIYESLISLKEKKLKYEYLLTQISEKIKEGQSFSSSLKDYPDSFGSLYIAIIQASEASGEIKEGFLALKVLLTKQIKLIKVLKSAFIYPTILLIFSFVIVNALIFFIIPTLKELFIGKEVNQLTAFILGISDFCTQHITELSLSSFFIVCGLLYLGKKGILKRALIQLALKIPFIERLVNALKFENFFSCLSLLLSRGINLKEALELAYQVLNHPQIEERVRIIILEILKGKKFSEVIEAPFPPVVKRLISLSESTGKTYESCQMLAEIFEEDVQKRLEKLTAFLQPLLLALIGFVIGVVILSILMPLTDVGGFI